MASAHRPPRAAVFPRHSAPQPHPYGHRVDLHGPTQCKKRSKTSSERGREYRERMKKLLETLEDDVLELRQCVADLEVRRSIADARSLQRRHDSIGSLAQLVHKYYTLFQDSMAAVPPPSITALVRHDHGASLEVENQYRFQTRFLQHIMDPDVVAGDLVGPLAIVDQWRRYAASHASFRATILSITTSGTDENPVVKLHARATGKITGATFYALFPKAVDKEELVKKFLNRTVSYDITNRYIFNEEGRICSEIVNIGFMQGLIEVGATIHEVAELMEASVISKHCTLHEKTAVEDATVPSTARHDEMPLSM